MRICSNDLSEGICSKDLSEGICSKDLSEGICSRDLSEGICSKDLSEGICSKDLSEALKQLDKMKTLSNIFSSTRVIFLETTEPYEIKLDGSLKDDWFLLCQFEAKMATISRHYVI